MIKNTFCFLPGVSVEKERKLWEMGVLDWDSFLARSKVQGLGREAKMRCDAQIVKAAKALEEKNSSFFTAKLNSAEHWRLYQEFREGALYLDIETSLRGEVTVVGLYDGEVLVQLVKGFNLCREALEEAFSQAKLLVTFNGKSFDIPVLKKRFNINPPQPHLDLRHACKRAGLNGGLKEVEKELSLSREQDLRGGDAALLWEQFAFNRNEEALESLLRYNAEDVLNLEVIAGIVTKRLEEGLKRGINAFQE